MGEEKHAEEHSSLIQTPKQLVIVVVLAFAVPVVVISLLAHLVTSSVTPSATNPGLTEEAIAKRLKPVGDVAIMSKEEREAKLAADKVAAASAPKPETVKPPAGAPAPVAAAKTDGAEGKKVYDTACAACHAAGVAGAPKFGDKTAWAARIKSGMDTLYASAIKGKNAMPPKGGNPALAEADVRAAVDFMVNQSK